MNYAIYTNKGKIRENNEDNYLLKLKPFPMIAVADGMGGHRAGEVASKLAINYLAGYRFNLNHNLLNQLEKVINEANLRIIKMGQENLSYNGMGTTLSLGLIYKQNIFIGHVGDSRIYLFRNNHLKQLTTDHSLVNELLKQKYITSQEAFNHPQRHIITQALGSDLSLKIEIKKIPLFKGDFLLFCTDGLSDLIEFNKLEIIFKMTHDLNKLSNQLGEQAMENGGHDNITLIIYEIN